MFDNFIREIILPNENEFFDLEEKQIKEFVKIDIVKEFLDS